MFTGRANAPLDEMAKLWISGRSKDGRITGLGDLKRRGRCRKIRDYCETDVANTWLLYCRFMLISGQLTPGMTASWHCSGTRSASCPARTGSSIWPPGRLRLEARGAGNPVVCTGAAHRRVAGSSRARHRPPGRQGRLRWRGALPGEQVHATVVQRRAWVSLKTVSVERPEDQPRQPRCPHFGVCGGCATQHVEAGARNIQAACARRDSSGISPVRAAMVLPPIVGPAWGYRHRARLTVRDVAKGGVLVGFHERGSSSSPT